ncbi:FeoA family protein [Parvibaculum sp.]|jgi:ferrous iron transport protein A|uniref:FeoA family protein n=1 Tax=Parvibaculum sp. TaxID=2024848 RepID=UPI000C897578|nr:FeoA family protein [Parvibaculum sp.]MAB15529.1 iron transporter FeoA [Parvibaculum sp.]|tara:strand:+ start:613 stop:900 length:288 start_codon:yes stop_codon:yes gene_type:complete
MTLETADQPTVPHWPLGEGRVGDAGIVTDIVTADDQPELERLLLEMGFVEGARVELIHEGPMGRDPIAVKVDDMRVALRRREAGCIMVASDSRPS